MLFTSIIFSPIFPAFTYNYFAERETTVTRNLLIDTRKGRVLSDQSLTHYYTDSRDYVTNDIFTTYNRALSPKRVPGFLGHRLAVSANLGISYPIFNYIFDRPGAIIDLRPALGLEWVTSTKNSLSLYLDYNRTLFYVDRGYYPKNWNGYSHVHPLYNTSILSADITYRHYTSNATAPLGTYIGWGAIASRLSLSPQAADVAINYLDSTYYRFGLSLEMGRNYIIANKLLFNIGIRYHFTIANPFTYDPDFDYDIPYEERLVKMQKIPVQQMNADLWVANLFLLHIGLGFLPL